MKNEVMLTFFIPKDLNERMRNVVKILNCTNSYVLRAGLTEFIEKVEREQINKKIIRGLKSFANTEKKIVEDFGAI